MDIGETFLIISIRYPLVDFVTTIKIFLKAGPFNNRQLSLLSNLSFDFHSHLGTRPGRRMCAPVQS